MELGAPVAEVKLFPVFPVGMLEVTVTHDSGVIRQYRCISSTKAVRTIRCLEVPKNQASSNSVDGRKREPEVRFVGIVCPSRQNLTTFAEGLPGEEQLIKQPLLAAALVALVFA